jgi:hypothetical protein
MNVRMVGSDHMSDLAAFAERAWTTSGRSRERRLADCLVIDAHLDRSLFSYWRREWN